MLARLAIGSSPRFSRVARLACAAALLIAGSTALIASSVGAAPADRAADRSANANGNGNANGQAHQVLTDPQPASNADATGNGANTTGPYDSTRDGSPSGNGNGTGQAVGEPCAGCVGKADNKNPPGQLPGGADANAGYECDRNHGIGRTNPAHTGCRTTPPTSPPPPPPTTPPPGGGGSSGGSSEQGQTPGQAVAGVTESAGSLASTGVPVQQMLGWSLGALLIGTALALAGRTRRPQSLSPARTGAGMVLPGGASGHCQAGL